MDVQYPHIDHPPFLAGRGFPFGVCLVESREGRENLLRDPPSSCANRLLDFEIQRDLNAERISGTAFESRVFSLDGAQLSRLQSLALQRRFANSCLIIVTRAEPQERVSVRLSGMEFHISKPVCYKVAGHFSDRALSARPIPEPIQPGNLFSFLLTTRPVLALLPSLSPASSTVDDNFRKPRTRDSLDAIDRD